MTLEQYNVSNMIKAMDTNQKNITVKNLPSQMLIKELDRRNEMAKKILAEVKGVLYGKGSNMSLVEMEETINQLREVLGFKTKKKPAAIETKAIDVLNEAIAEVNGEFIEV